MKNLTLILLSLLCGYAYGQTSAVTFTPPTTRSDGSALPSSQIAGYDVQCASWAGAGGLAGTCPPGMLLTSTLPGGSSAGGPVSLSIPGTGGTVCLRLVTTDTAGLKSDPSLPGCKTFAPIKPSPPTNVTVAVVIGLSHAPVLPIAANGARGTTILGFVRVGLECTGAPAFTYRGRTWRQVSTLPVQWWNSAPTAAAAAPCS